MAVRAVCAEVMTVIIRHNVLQTLPIPTQRTQARLEPIRLLLLAVPTAAAAEAVVAVEPVVAVEQGQAGDTSRQQANPHKSGQAGRQGLRHLPCLTEMKI